MKKHIVCLGDSNTHGYCADPSDCAEGGIRFNESERWTCLLQTALGENYLVAEKKADDFYQVICREKLADTHVQIGIEAQKPLYRFLVFTEGTAREIGTASSRFLMCEFAGRCFTGTLWGVFAESASGSGAEAVFDL